MKVNKYIIGKITKINKNFVIFWTEDNRKGIVHISEISDFYISDINEIFTIGEIVEFLVKSFDNEIYYCSFKCGRTDYLNFPFEYKIEETKKGFKNLMLHNKKEVLKWKK